MQTYLVKLFFKDGSPALSHNVLARNKADAESKGVELAKAALKEVSAVAVSRPRRTIKITTTQNK